MLLKELIDISGEQRQDTLDWEVSDVKMEYLDTSKECKDVIRTILIQNPSNPLESGKWRHHYKDHILDGTLSREVISISFSDKY